MRYQPTRDTCLICNGTGKVSEAVKLFDAQTQSPAGTCPKCHGKGYIEGFKSIPETPAEQATGQIIA